MTTNPSDSQLLKVGHMTYLNSEVFYRKLATNACDLVALPPRAMAAAVESGELQAGPLPIAEVHRLGGKVRSLGNMGVACTGPAMSVFLFSHKPVEDLSGANIAVTSHTATSIQLLRVLFVDLWSVADHKFVEMADDHVSALVIGDPALQMLANGSYEYSYDLGTAWHELTGLPFVFAEWVVRSDAPENLDDSFERSLIQATQTGMESVEEISKIRANESMSENDVATYVRNFSYFFGPDERVGQQEFKLRLSKLPEWRPAVLSVNDSSETRAVSTS
jgi:chorismate dehydratase